MINLRYILKNKVRPLAVFKIEETADGIITLILLSGSFSEKIYS